MPLQDCRRCRGCRVPHAWKHRVDMSFISTRIVEHGVTGSFGRGRKGSWREPGFERKGRRMGKAAWRTVWRTASLSVVLGVALAGAATQAQAVTIHELYAGLVGTGGPNHIAAGRDGNLWFTGHNEASIDRITPQGVLDEFFLTPNSSPEGITVGPNGRLWFTEPGWDRIGRITAAGSLTEFASNGITGQ